MNWVKIFVFVCICRRFAPLTKLFMTWHHTKTIFRKGDSCGRQGRCESRFSLHVPFWVRLPSTRALFRWGCGSSGSQSWSQRGSRLIAQCVWCWRRFLVFSVSSMTPTRPKACLGLRLPVLTLISLRDWEELDVESVRNGSDTDFANLFFICVQYLRLQMFFHALVNAFGGHLFVASMFYDVEIGALMQFVESSF